MVVLLKADQVMHLTNTACHDAGFRLSEVESD